MTDTFWRRRPSALPTWELITAIKWGVGDRMYPGVLGSIRKVKNSHRCRVWVVMYEDRTYEHLGTLKDMKLPEAREAAKLLIMVRHQQ